MSGKMAVALGSDRGKGLAAALEALGGMQVFIKPGDRVLIKVNAAFASPPAVGATTNPELLSAMIRLCLEARAAQVLVTDNPIQDPVACFNFSGLSQACDRSGAKLTLPSAGSFAALTLEGGQLLRNWPVLFGPFKGVNKLIGMAPVKDHHRSGASLSMKNWYGLLGGNRAIFHQNIHQIILELAMMVRPTLVVLDGVQSMMANGPTGGSLDDLKPTNTLIVSTDQVAADAFAAGLLDKNPADLPFINLASRAGLGQADFQRLNPIKVQTG
jgi:uncharacterized protein (DUF362 family)